MYRRWPVGHGSQPDPEVRPHAQEVLPRDLLLWVLLPAQQHPQEQIERVHQVRYRVLSLESRDCCPSLRRAESSLVGSEGFLLLCCVISTTLKKFISKSFFYVSRSFFFSRGLGNVHLMSNFYRDLLGNVLTCFLRPSGKREVMMKNQQEKTVSQ